MDELIKKSIDAMPCMDDDPDSYVKTISEVLKDPRQDQKIISNVVKEISINWKYYYTCKFLDAWSNIVSTTSQVTFYYPLYCINVSFL